MHGTMDFPFLLAYYQKRAHSHAPASPAALELREELRCHLQMITDDHTDFCTINQYFAQAETAASQHSHASTAGGGKPTPNNSLFERLTGSVFPAVMVHYVTLMQCLRLRRRLRTQWQRANEPPPKRIDDDDDDNAGSAAEEQRAAARFAWDLPSKVPGHVSLPYSSTMSCLTFFQLSVNRDEAGSTAVPPAAGGQLTNDADVIANGSVVTMAATPPAMPPTTSKNVRMALAQWFIQALILYVAERQDCVLDAYHSLASPAAGGGSGYRAALTSPVASTPPPVAATAASFFARFHPQPAATAAATHRWPAPAARQRPPPVQALPSVTTLLQLLQDCTADLRRAVVVGGTLGSLRAVSRELHRWQQTAPLAALLTRHQQVAADAGLRTPVVETERLTTVVLQVGAQVAHGLLEDLREPLQATSQLGLSAAATATAIAMERPSGTHADLEVLLRTVQCVRAAIRAHQPGAALAPDAQTALGCLFCHLARAVLQLPGGGDGGEAAARPRHTCSTYLYAAQTARYLDSAFLTVCGGIDALLHDYPAGCPAYLCAMLGGLCAGAARSVFERLRQQRGALWERSAGALDTIEAAALVLHAAAQRQRQLALDDDTADRDAVCALFTPSPELALYQLQQQQRRQDGSESPAVLQNVLLGRLPASGDGDAEGGATLGGGDRPDRGGYADGGAAPRHRLCRDERLVDEMVRFTEYMLLFYQKEWLLDRTEVHPIFLLAM
ncbi:hypothetical protein STCU_10482 [Strigomonas culicis]|uniref:Uncharacterized protein n=1 Tax=Strigomonas culicis TaxID=28005 RepID=S9TLI1_9TRYP|nr:hypothetical protein STCU_10482 [Strigomonas culicis]|eukprot:EPY17659.1 hypothetical protein STCU_10482 [Strigomonas culicis]